MRAPLDTSTSDIVLVFLVCALILCATWLVWDVLRIGHCTDCGARPKPRTGADLDAMQAHPGCCQDCARRRIKVEQLLRAYYAECAAHGCVRSRSGGDACARCKRPLTIERTTAS